MTLARVEGGGDTTGAGRPAPAGGEHPGSAALDPVVLATLMESAPVGFAVFDTELRFQRINERLAEMNGFTVEEHLGRRVFELLPELREVAEPLLRGVLETGVPLVDVELSGETPAQPGTTRSWRESFFPVMGDGGRPVGLAAVATEITEHKRLESQLFDALALLDTVLMNAPVGVAVVDPEGRYLRINPKLAELNGRTVEEHLGRRIDEVLLSRDVAARIHGWVAEVAATGRPILDRDLQGRNVADLELEVLASYYPVRGSAGEVTAVGIVVVDITERARVQRHRTEALEQTLDVQGNVLDELQRMLLPDVPRIDGVDLSAHYLSAEEVVQVGGDWYDCFPTADGRVALAVGDAVGHGLPAVRTMDQVRNFVRAFLLDGGEPGEVFTRVNDAAHHPEAEFATAVVAVLDAHSGVAELPVAGHPPVLVHRADGRVERMEAPAGPPLGVVRGHRYRTGRAELAPGDSLVLYTDGLVERRGEVIDEGIDRLAGACTGPADGPGALAEAVLDVCARGQRLGDDAYLLVATLSPTPGEAP